MHPNTINPLAREDEHWQKEYFDREIERLIDKALTAKQVTFNRHGVGGFELSTCLLPPALPFDRLGLYDAILLNGNGCAQVRRRKNNISTIVFNIDPEVTIE